MPDMARFKQTKGRAWVLLFIVLSSALGVIVSLFTLNWYGFSMNLAFGMGAFWIDKLEKEITRRNKNPIKLPEEPT